MRGCTPGSDEQKTKLRPLLPRGVIGVSVKLGVDLLGDDRWHRDLQELLLEGDEG